MMHDKIPVMKFGQSANVGTVNSITLWTADVDKVWAPGNGSTGIATEEFFLASDNSADTGKQIAIDVVKTGYVEERVFLSLDGTDAQTPVLLPIGNCLSVQQGAVLSPTAGDIWVGRNPGSFSNGRPADADIEMHIGASKGVTHHGFFTVPSRIIGNPYAGPWRCTISRYVPSSSDSVRVKFFCYPIDPVQITGDPLWEIDSQSFSGTGTPIEFDPPLGTLQSQRAFKAGTRLELKAIALMGNAEVEGRLFLELVRDGEFLDRDSFNIPPFVDP